MARDAVDAAARNLDHRNHVASGTSPWNCSVHPAAGRISIEAWDRSLAAAHDVAALVAGPLGMGAEEVRTAGGQAR
jgi:hypothetical protein